MEVKCVFILYFTTILSLLMVLSSQAAENGNVEFCEIGVEHCDSVTLSKINKFNSRYIFYDVNPVEGFNLRRDVYMRMAIFTHNLKKDKNFNDTFLVLPPFTNLVHWKSKDVGKQTQIPWSLFFNVKSLKSFAPVLDLYEVFEREKYIVFDRIYNLQNYPNPFENGVFKDKWEVQGDSDCLLTSNFWGYNNITYKHMDCVMYQGYAKMLKELIQINPQDKMILFTNAQIPLHDHYGSKMYWKSRMSMKFNNELILIAENFMQNNLNCTKSKCDNYIAVHWRRKDFAQYRAKDVPSINGTVQQILTTLTRTLRKKINTVFLASDSHERDFEKLVNILSSHNINVEWYLPSTKVKNKFKDGGVAIIDQIICSHAAHFVGTHESTFSLRIQEEREILGFDSESTFNRFCPDSGECEEPSKWLIQR